MMTTEQAAILERMRTAGRSYGEIACRIGKSPGAVRWYCLRNGIESPRTARRYAHVVPGSVQRRGNGVVRRYTPQEDALIEEMRTAGATIG